MCRRGSCLKRNAHVTLAIVAHTELDSRYENVREPLEAFDADIFISPRIFNPNGIADEKNLGIRLQSFSVSKIEAKKKGGK